MSTLSRRFALLALTFGAGLALAGAADAQFRVVPFRPNPLVAPGVTQAQYLASVRAYAAAASTIPPWLSGYNPSPVIPTPFGGYGGNPYSPGGGYPGMTNP